MECQDPARRFDLAQTPEINRTSNFGKRSIGQHYLKFLHSAVWLPGSPAEPDADFASLSTHTCLNDAAAGAVFDPTPASRMRYAVRDEPCMTRLTTMAAMPARTALAIGDDSMSVIGLDPDACS
jgi:hypothetical protein